MDDVEIDVGHTNMAMDATGDEDVEPDLQKASSSALEDVQLEDTGDRQQVNAGPSPVVEAARGDASTTTTTGGSTDDDELRLRVDKLTTNEAATSATVSGTTSVVVGGGSSSDDGFGSAGFSRDRPYSASMRSRATVASSRSRVSMSPSLMLSDYSSQNLFSYRVRYYNTRYL